MDICKRHDCVSYALNEHPESGYCDKCYYRHQVDVLLPVVKTLMRKHCMDDTGKVLAVALREAMGTRDYREWMKEKGQ